ncbi:MAG: Flp family type IVb pilin [Acidimicrobiia bacterium]|nr:Flp family type IVb pilin [Acidimicrobiia bacterium]
MLTTLTFLTSWLQARAKDERGASLVEYALLVALIAVVCIAAIAFIGNVTPAEQFGSVGSDDQQRWQLIQPTLDV